MLCHSSAILAASKSINGIMATGTTAPGSTALVITFSSSPLAQGMRQQPQVTSIPKKTLSSRSTSEMYEPTQCLLFFRANLSVTCNGFDNAIMTQNNTPIGSNIVYSGEKKNTLQVNKDFFNLFLKENPFSNKQWDTCSVVGNGGILFDSGCGKMIDSADFVIRCNLPPLENGYEKDVGSKTSLVTANPSIIFNKYGALTGRRLPFVEYLHKYGNSLLLLPAFSFSKNTAVCQRAAYTIEDFKSPIRPVFSNAQYLDSLDQFWSSKGLNERRLSTGFIMVSMALELCKNVHVYGFWPFSNHPYGLYTLTNHYYDDVPTKTFFHSMPAEFERLLQLHTEGVLRLHLGDCKTGDN
uniref:ST8 alpha-N-acetyl-neuraminide alpha-2,8-sialyltransferase 6 n=1 Tax=Neolamprologus brichardi TaxID=32507 RepID=A0A3Q4I7J1_NEOBR